MPMFASTSRYVGKRLHLSEYGRALIREDIDLVEHRKYAMRALLNAQEEIQRGEVQPFSALDAVDAELADEF